jgi:hypothetical protein
VVDHAENIGGTMGTALEGGASFSRVLPIRRIMPIPIIAALLGAAIGGVAKKSPKKKAVSGYKTKKGKRVKAYLKRG